MSAWDVLLKNTKHRKDELQLGVRVSGAGSKYPLKLSQGTVDQDQVNHAHGGLVGARHNL